MSAHIQVYLGEKDGWHVWCQTSSFITEGKGAKTQFALHDAARAAGHDPVCGQKDLETAQAFVDWLKIHRPSVQFKAVDGPCQRRDPYDYEAYFQAEEATPRDRIRYVAQNILTNTESFETDSPEQMRMKILAIREILLPWSK